MDSTVDAREVEFYSALADVWWDRDGPFWPLHTLNRLRVDYICEHLCRHFDRDRNQERPLDGLRVLDVGCGGGILSESMARLGAIVTGIDVVEKNIGIASHHAERENLRIDYRLRTVAEHAELAEPYDVVLNMEVVEHVADLDAFLEDCANLAAVGGVMFVATINRTLLSWLTAIVGAEYVLRWLPKGTHRWTWFRKPAEICRPLEQRGFSIADQVGVTVNPITRSMHLSRRLAVNYMLFGIRSATRDAD